MQTVPEPIIKEAASKSQTAGSQYVAAIPPDVALSAMALLDDVLIGLSQASLADLTSLVGRMAASLAGGIQVRLAAPNQPVCGAEVGYVTASEPVLMGGVEQATLVVSCPPAAAAQARGLARVMASALSHLADLRERQDRLWREARTDELTNLANGRYFREFLTEKLAWSQEAGLPITLLLFDIDNFKQYNEQYGHAAGDRILRQMAGLLRQCCRSHDLVSRLSGGGDEFAVVFWDKGGPRQPRVPGSPQFTVVSPLQVFERFRARLASEAFPDLGPKRLGRLTISAGMAVHPTDAHDVDSLILAADEAMMFHAKRTGKNRIHIVGPDPHSP